MFSKGMQSTILMDSLVMAGIAGELQQAMVLVLKQLRQEGKNINSLITKDVVFHMVQMMVPFRHGQW